MVKINCKTRKVCVEGNEPYHLYPLLSKVINFLNNYHKLSNYKTLWEKCVDKKDNNKKKTAKQNKTNKKTKTPAHSWFDSFKNDKYNKFRTEHSDFPDCLKFEGEGECKSVKLVTDGIEIEGVESSTQAVGDGAVNIEEIKRWIQQDLNIEDGDYLSAFAYINFLLTGHREKRFLLSLHEQETLIYAKVIARICLMSNLALWLKYSEKSEDEYLEKVEIIGKKYSRILDRFYDGQEDIETLQEDFKKYLAEVDLNIKNDMIDMVEIFGAGSSKDEEIESFDNKAYEINYKINLLIEEDNMQLEDIYNHPFWQEAKKKIEQLSAPSGKAAGFLTISQFTLTTIRGLPKGIKNIIVYIDEDTEPDKKTIAIKFDFKPIRRRFFVKLYICPSEIGEDIVDWSGVLPELEYAYEYSAEIEKGQPYLILELGKLKGDKEVEMVRLFDLRRTKIITTAS